MNSLPDVQNGSDSRQVPIQWVGINNYRIPFKIKMKSGESQTSISTVELFTDLSQELRGANMSRYSQVVEKGFEKYEFGSDALVDMLHTTKKELDSKNARVTVRFPYFIKKRSPIREVESHFVVDCSFCGVLDNDVMKLYLQVDVDYTSVCPCSKEMSLTKYKIDSLEFSEEKVVQSGFGAHNQRSQAKVRVRFRDLEQFVWIEDLIDLVEESVSCPIWNTLKRPDEKYVTETAYENPVFVEDSIRNISMELDQLKPIDWYKVEVVHFESIHQSNAVARIERSI